MALTPAEKQRAYRERKRAEAEAKAAEARNGRNTVPGTVMRDSVEATIAAAKWLTGADAASMTQARLLAEDVDVLRHEGDTTKALAAQRALSRVLSDLGATATKRQQYELRSRKAEAQAEGSDGGDDSTGTPGNVTQLKRPPKRRA